MVARTGLFVAPLPGGTPAGTSPTDGRLVLGAAFGTTGGCLTGGAMTASASAMTVSIAAAVWRIPDPTNTAGVYLSPADADSFTFSAGPASGSRIDVLYVRQNNYEAGDANSRLVYGVAAGTAASSPTEPAVPAGALKIGRLTVPTGASNAAACTLSATYPTTAAAPPVVVSSKTLLAGLTGQYVGQLAFVGAVTYRWTGAQPWVITGDAARAHVENQATAQAFTHATYTDLLWDTAVSDPGSVFAANAGPFLATPFPGLYRVTVKATFDGADSTSAVVRMQLVDSQSTSRDNGAVLGLIGSTGSTLTGHAVMSGSSSDGGDKLKVQVMQTSGGTRNSVTSPAAVRTRINLQYLGPV